MKHSVWAAALCVVLAGHNHHATAQSGVQVFCSDTLVTNTFEWAKRTALSYAHHGSDPVGLWYEAALPQREAFCMRDVAHQSTGAHIIGLAGHNKNMLHKFAQYISDGKDWCTYWEINRHDLPAPIDYVNDQEFWYNLCGNPDVIQACYKMYRWTADEDYLRDTTFCRFYRLSLDQYISRWQLSPDSIMLRPRFMNKPEPFNPDNHFHTCRGLASYVENFAGLSVGVDLIAALYAGYHAHATMASLTRQHATARRHEARANRYRQLLDTRWWDADSTRYNTFWTEEGKFYRGEGIPFMLWFGATDRTDRLRASVHDILSRDWNVENLSYLPALLYRLGYTQEAHRILLQLPHVHRSDYPEVSYATVEGVVCGCMGIDPEAESGIITTCCKLPDPQADISVGQLPVWDGTISVSHQGHSSSTLTNHTNRTVRWRAEFMGEHNRLYCAGKAPRTYRHTDVYGNTYTYIYI